MIEDQVRDLKHNDPGRRRKAIMALAKSTDPRIMQALFYVATTDPDPAIRDLAGKAGQQVQKMQWKQAAIEAAPAGEPDTGTERKKIARGHLDSAFSLKLKDDQKNALAELAEALRIDPGLARDSGALGLASELLGGAPVQAMATLLQQIEDGDVAPRRHRFVRTRLTLKQGVIILVELIILFGVLNLFVAIWATLLATQSNAPQVLLGSLRRVQMAKIVPIAAFVLGVVVLATALMHTVAAYLNGIGSFIRFMSVMLGVQALSFLIATAALTFLPLVTIIPNPGSGAFAISPNYVLLTLGTGSIALWEASFVSRTQRVSLSHGVAAVLVGSVVAIVIGAILGLFRLLGFS
jgi:hypothetical protein